MKLMQLTIVLAISIVAQVAEAAIIGMLYEDASTKVELVSMPNDIHGSARIAITSNYKNDVIYFSRFLGGEGGGMETLQALIEGRIPPHTEIHEWMAPDAAGNESVKIGIFTADSDQKFIFDSAYTGRRTEIPRVEAQPASTKQLADGRFKQVFDFPITQALSGSQLIDLAEGKINVSLITQHSQGYSDSSLKRTVELPTKSAFRGYLCRKLVFEGAG